MVGIFTVGIYKQQTDMFSELLWGREKTTSKYNSRIQSREFDKCKVIITAIKKKTKK